MLDASWQQSRNVDGGRSGCREKSSLCILHPPLPQPTYPPLSQSVPPPTSLSASLVQAPAAEALDTASLDGLDKRLDTLEAAAKDKLVEQVRQ